MPQLKVIVTKLNKRKAIPASFAEKNIVGTVQKGFLFEGNEIQNIANPSSGKWYVDNDGFFYWGGGLVVLDIPLGITINLNDSPVNLPQPYRAGIDISHHNNIHDWLAIKNAGITFVYIKLSEGVGTPDANAKKNALAAKQHNLKIGYYHFCRPDTKNGGTVINDATAEADEALKRMAVIPTPDLPLVLDLEDQEHWDTPLNKVDYLKWINTFINRIKTKSSMECMIYSRKGYLDSHLPADHNLGSIKLWVSRYTLRDAQKLTLPVGWDDWSIWQYCEDGVIGSNSKLDINILKDQSLF